LPSRSPAVPVLSDPIIRVARDGRSKHQKPSGSPEMPLSGAQFEAKFRDCAKNAVRPLSPTSIDSALATIAELETVADVRALLTPFEA